MGPENEWDSIVTRGRSGAATAPATSKPATRAGGEKVELLENVLARALAARRLAINGDDD